MIRNAITYTHTLALLLSLLTCVPAVAQEARQPAVAPTHIQPLSLPTSTLSPPVTFVAIAFRPLEGVGIPIVHVRLNNHIDANFIVDTGSNCCIMRSRLANALAIKLQKKHLITSSDLAPAGTDIPYVHVDSLRIGKEVLDLNGDVLVDDSIWDHFPGSIDGILGGNVFTDRAVMFYFEKQYIYVIPKGNLTDTQLTYMGMGNTRLQGISMAMDDEEGTMFRVPVRITDSGADGIFARIPGGAKYPRRLYTSLLVDTGSVRTIAVRNKDFPTGEPLRETFGLTVHSDGNLPVAVYPMDSLQVGNAPEITRLICGFLPEQYVTQKVGGILGLDILSRFHVLIDYPARKMYLMPVPHDAGVLYPTETARVNAQRTVSDMVIEPSPEGKWRVESLEAGGPFSNAGIKAGDVIETVNGKNPTALWPDSVLALFESTTSLHLQVQRNGKLITLSLIIIL